MQTQICQQPGIDDPHLMMTVEEKSQPVRISLDSFPFTLGRNDSCDYTIDSAKVSREHLLIQREGSHFLVRDLKSTNGTMVNGVSIQEQILSDGDTITVADYELDFFSGIQKESRATITMQMDVAQGFEVKEDTYALGVQAIRRLQEMCLSSSIPILYDQLLHAENGDLFGVALNPLLEYPRDQFNPTEKQIFQTECRLSDRMLTLQRIHGLETVPADSRSGRYFIQLTNSEIGSNITLNLIHYLSEQLGPEQKLVIAIPSEAVTDVPIFQRFMSSLIHFGCEIAISDFSISSPLLSGQVSWLPHYLEFKFTEKDSSITDPKTQSNLPELVSFCQSNNITTIAGRIVNQQQSALCREFGISLLRSGRSSLLSSVSRNQVNSRG